MPLLCRTENLGKSFGNRLLFQGISLSLDDGQRTGLVGANGSGKSTLLKILAGLDAPDAGEISLRRQLRIGYLAQEDSFAADALVINALTDAQVAGKQHSSDPHEREVEASILLRKVGFTDLEQPVAELSGGWRKRLAIARAMFLQPDLLLLDEPTNHLDLEGILWLEKLLASAPFGFLLVSHDRYFLENICNRTIELSRAYEDGYLSVDGPYSQLLEKRQLHLTAQQSRQSAVASRVRGEIEWLRRGAKARTTKAKGRIEQAGELMEDLADLQRRNAAAGVSQIDFAASGRKTRKLLECKSIAKSLGGRSLFSDVSLVLAPGSKLGLLGPNGSGKSTLIRLLSGELSPDAGEIRRADALRVVVFDQRRQQLDRSLSLRDALSPTGDLVNFNGQTQHIVGWAQRFLFRSEQLDLPVGELSGGEQARVLVANLMRQAADVLILDEPTNDLDIATLEVLEESLQEFPGALVLVTHDRYLLDRVCDGILALDGSGAANSYADLAQWETARKSRGASEREESRRNTARQTSGTQTGVATKAPKKLSYMEQRELDAIEPQIAADEKAVELLQQQMGGADVLRDPKRLHALCEELSLAQLQLAKRYARWEALERKRTGE